jgi:hypothetical protein
MALFPRTIFFLFDVFFLSIGWCFVLARGLVVFGHGVEEGEVAFAVG